MDRPGSAFLNRRTSLMALLAAPLAGWGAPVHYRLFDGLNHTTILAALARPLNWLAPVLPEVLAFVNSPAHP